MRVPLAVAGLILATFPQTPPDRIDREALVRRHSPTLALGTRGGAAVARTARPGAPAGHAPGFPADGSWTVRWEGLQPMP